MFQFEPGDVIFTADKTLTSFLIKQRQGDFAYSHVCIAAGDGTIYTTGASGPPFYRYGVVDASTYLAGKKYKVKRYLGLTSPQKTMILLSAQSLMGKVYNIVGLLWLNMLAFKGTVVKKLGNKPKFNFNYAVFCTQSVAYCFWKAGIQLNPEAGKEDPTAYTLESIYYDPNLKTVFRQDKAIRE